MAKYRCTVCDYIYDPAQGEVGINCSHDDLRGDPISEW